MSGLKIQSFGSGEPLVLLHGWGFDSGIWTPLLPELESYHVILVDLPGFGQSPYMDWPLFKSTLLQQLPHIFTLLGWSLGGLYATRLAIEEHQRVKQLINVTSSPCFIREPAWPGISLSNLDDFYQSFQTAPQQTRAKFTASQTQGQIHMPWSDDCDMQGLEKGLLSLKEWDLREMINKLPIRVSYLFGRLDTIVPAKLMKVMQQIYPQFDYHFFDNSAHMPFLSQSQLFIDTLRKILC